MKKITLWCLPIFLFSLFMSCNGSSNTQIAKSDTGNARKEQDLDTVQTLTSGISALKCAEISKADYDALAAGINTNTGKLIIRFSGILSSNNLFDLEIYAAKKHDDYAEGTVPKYAMATRDDCLPINSGEKYVLGNNEKSLRSMNEILNGVTWTKIRFTPILDPAGTRQVIFSISTYRGIAKNDEVLPLANYYTNPSPPRKAS